MVLSCPMIGLVGAIMLLFETKYFACAGDTLFTNRYRRLRIYVPSVIFLQVDDVNILQILQGGSQILPPPS